MPRSRQPARFSSEAPSESSSSTSPDRTADDDTDFFTAQANDSQSSVGLANGRDLHAYYDSDRALPPVGRLPPEILIAIFAKLSSPADMISCMLSISSTVGDPNGFFSYSELIRRLNLSALSSDVSDGTVMTFAQCNRIERLTLTNCSKLSDKGVSDLVEGNRHLQALDVSDLRHLTDHTLHTVAKNCPRLQGLNITNCIKVTDESLIVVSRNCRQIKRLKLNGVAQVTDKSILSFAQSCPAILEIDLHDCKLVTNQSITALMTTLQTLRELRLAHCSEIDDMAFLELPPHISLDSLRILDLTSCENVKDAAVERIVASAPRLRNLVLAKCRFITDRAVWAICKLGKNLHYVHLGHCSNITDAAVIQLVKSCNRIRYIDLACCIRLTDASVQQLATLPKLRRIGLVKCQNITDNSILALAGPKASHHSAGISSLERVHLSYCTHLTCRGIQALVNSCPRLTHLSLTGIHEFYTRDEVTAHCREAPPEFTNQQREVFCVFSGDGVNKLRTTLNHMLPPIPPQDLTEATMYDDDEELDEDEGQVTGLMRATAATAINDDEYIDIGHTHGNDIMTAAFFRLGFSSRNQPTPSFLRISVFIPPLHCSSAQLEPKAAMSTPRANPLAFTRWPVTLITTAVYLAFVIPLLIVHHILPSAPSPSSTPNGLDLHEAWADLQVLTNGYHPYNSRRNDEVREWLLRRVKEIVHDNDADTPDPGLLAMQTARVHPVAFHSHQGAAEPTVYSTDDDTKPTVYIFDDNQSNLSFVGNTLKSSNTAVYFEGTNLIVYIRGEDDEDWSLESGQGGEGGVLVNAHYDSVSTGYGATDDGVGVVTCLQLIKYFTTPGHTPRRGVVVLFNNGEEDFLNGARVFSQHPLSKFTRTFLNLEGAGAGGRAILFRGSDTEVTRNYRRAKHPFGSVLAANGFEVGLISSQTDYVVFEGDLGMRGLDVAFMEPRDRYHTDQDDSRHTTVESLWHMLEAAVKTTEGLVSDDAGKKGSRGVWFDLFGATFVVFQLHTLFALSVTMLIVAPLGLLLTSVALSRADKMYLFRSTVKGLDDGEAVSLQGLRGFFRFPFLFVIPTAVTVGLAYLVTKVNPLIIHSSEYAVWGMMLSAWTFLAWFVSRVADFARPSAFHRVYTLTWMFVLAWVMLVIATVYENQWGLAGGYWVFFSFCGTFLATWISYLELFALPRKSEYASQYAPVAASSRRPSTYGGSRLGTASGEEHTSEHDGDEHAESDDEQPTESTSLLGGGQRTTFANYVHVTGGHDDHDEPSDPNIYGLEQRWSAHMPKWTWVLQFLLTAPIVLIMVGPLALLLTSALHQTGQDGSSSLFIYISVAALTTFLLTPLLPYIHRHTYHIPLFLLAIFLGCLIYNLVAFPFSASNRLKIFFQQEINLDTAATSVSLIGISPFVAQVAHSLPSAQGQKLACDPFAQRTKCSWSGPMPDVVPSAPEDYKSWLTFNISSPESSRSATNDPHPAEGDNIKTAQIQVSGRNTRACKLLFDTPISSFSVAGSAYDPRFPHTSPRGTKEIRLWSREWENTWTVDVEWTVPSIVPEEGGVVTDGNGEEYILVNPSSSRAGEEDDDAKLKGRVVCLWSDHNRVGAIPALDEVKQYAPVWVAATKFSDGLVEGYKDFEV
ncbi:uncharacterized protein BO97DRAFT_436449 [Aspergillus homomorphus CBS 101889]|uniref:Peptide hydrolase n=1 Tax=Aspergillus homomorphus (strain CBS 101889) TaxID=1450537 RepID=A0A395HRH8_ASPHC|nr:hypothetical protein BO97DRAFT_436449 [Aspergillus homomorphus CBS 101889]RAL09945.1 hypothetical protein BO97DRAFT_436449 [Aspergillus homomorphus CBS 101889]